MKEVKLKCPKCKKNEDISLQEAVVGFIDHSIQDGDLIIGSNSDAALGYGGRIDAVCEACGHEWRLRGVRGGIEDLKSS